MIIVNADSAAEAADLHDLLSRHLVWRHRIYVGDAEYRPEAPAASPRCSAQHGLLRQALREASGPLSAQEAWVALAGCDVVVARETVHRWVTRDIAAGLIRVADGGLVWAGDPA